MCLITRDILSKKILRTRKTPIIAYKIVMQTKKGTFSPFAAAKGYTWKVGKKESLSLCSKCHEYKDPFSFVF